MKTRQSDDVDDDGTSKNESHTTVLCNAFEAFMRCSNDQYEVDAVQLGSCALNTPMTMDDANSIISTTSRTQNTLNFEAFFTVFFAHKIFREIASKDFLGVDALRSALNNNHIKFEQTDINAMLNGSKDMNFSTFFHTYCKQPKYSIVSFLKIWLQSSKSMTTTQLSNSIVPKNTYKLNTIEDFIAGTFAGIVITLVGHPFDTIKVRLQTSTPGVFNGGIDCVQKTLRREGIRGMYKGMASPMSTVPLINAVVFAAYGQAKGLLCDSNTSLDEIPLVKMSIAGMYAGFINSLIVCPVELVKTQLQIQYGNKTNNTVHLRGPIACARKLYSVNGPKSLFRGMSVTVVREVFGYGGQFCVYEFMKRNLCADNQQTHELGVLRLLLAGGVSGMAAWIISYPADYIKSQLQAQAPLSCSPNNVKFPKHSFLPDGGAISCWRHTMRHYGFRHLFTGFAPCLARAFPANAAGFGAYEIAAKFLQVRHHHNFD